jgi:hypothetical protein
MTHLSDTQTPGAPAASQEATDALAIAEARQRVKALLETRPVASMQQTSEGFVLRPTLTGFDISLLQGVRGRGWTLLLDGWFEEEISLDHAMKLIELSLRGDLRVIRTTANGRPWIYEAQKRIGAQSLNQALKSFTFAISSQMTTTDGSSSAREWIELGRIGYVRIFSCFARKKTEIITYPVSK